MRLLVIPFVAGALALSSCTADKPRSVGDSHVIDDYRPVDGNNKIDFFASKDGRHDPDCFYTGKGGPLPPWDSTNYKPKKVVVFFGNGPRSGPLGLKRLSLNQSLGVTDADFLDFIEKEGVQNIDGFFNNLGNNALQAYDYSDRELSIGNALNRPPNPGDIVIPWYSEIFFVLTDAHERFNQTKPFRVANNVPNSQSPFYKSEIKGSGDRVLEVKYLSLPQRDHLKLDYIKKRRCIYYYDLSILQSTTNEGIDFEFSIILDPDGEGGGGPRGNEPPGWP